MLARPPPEIRPNFANINHLHLIFESASSWRHPLSDCLAFSNVTTTLKKGSTVAVVNVNQATRRLHKLDSLRSAIETKGARLAVQQLTQERKDKDWFILDDKSIGSARQHLQPALDLSNTHAFYTNSGIMIVQALRGYSLGTTHQLDLYQDTLDQYCHLKGIKHLYAIAQTSQSSRNSLNRQQTLLSLLCPPPTTHEVITVNAESVFSVNTIAEQLQSIKNLLVLFTLVDWPKATGFTFRSAPLPLILPVLFLRPSDNFNLTNLVERCAKVAGSFVDGLRHSTFQSDLSAVLLSTLLPEQKRRFSDSTLDSNLAPAIRASQAKSCKRFAKTLYDFEDLPPLAADAPLKDLVFWARISDEDGT
ncbi:hypothetical protein T439DRAFT_372523 [Meredithblackwellia eburnea MCA 4105]